MRDLHELPKLRDGLSYLYLERGRIEQKHKAVEFVDREKGRTMIPAAALAVLLLGPGTSITHAAIKALADNGCLVVWVGEDGTRCYAQGGGETRKAYHLLRQAELGYRLVLIADKPKTIWAGLGNRSGLHDHARVILQEKWDKSGRWLSRKLHDLPGDTVVEVQHFHNINRDMGGWCPDRRVTLAST